MSSPSQVEFYFCGPPMSSGHAERTNYSVFSLNGVEYKVGDHVFLYPEDEGVPPYVGKILSSFVDTSGRAADPHCVEVAWYERRAHLEPADFNSAGWERELVALEETDVNPIGCISGKAMVLKAIDYEEASNLAESLSCVDWFFCRGVYRQAENRIVMYPEIVEQLEACDAKRFAKRPHIGLAGEDEGVADSDDVKRLRVAEEFPVAPLRRTGKLVSGRTCVECGATQTPQWREGPAGPKTLCNACGVRYVRAQQRASKQRAASMASSRSTFGSGGRQSRTSKAAKAEAAAARGAARAAAAAAAEEASQRPLRQAALMAASKTAQYARTGIFPQTASELCPSSAPGSPRAALLHQQQQQQSPQQDGSGGAFAAAPEPRPATPNCSSFDSSSAGSHHDEVTVEVVVGPAEGDAECGAAATAGPAAAAASGGGGGCGAYMDGAAYQTAVVTMAMTAAALLPPPAAAALPLMSMPMPMPSAATRFAPGISIVSPMGGATHLAQQPQPAPALGGATQGSVAVGDVCTLLHSASATAGAGPAVAGGCGGSPAHSGSGGGCFGGMVPVGTGISGPSGILPGSNCGSGVGCMESPIAAAAAAAAPQIISAPVSPSARCDAMDYCLVMPGSGGCGDGVNGHCVDVGSLYDNGNHHSLYGGDFMAGLYGHHHLSQQQQQLLRDDVLGGCCLQLPFGDPRVGAADEEDGCGSCGALGGLGDDMEYGPLVEMDFGLGPAEVLSGGGLFDDELHADPCGGVAGVADLPAAAARAAPYCSDLAPGSEARELLDAMPLLLTGSNPPTTTTNNSASGTTAQVQTPQQQQQPAQADVGEHADGCAVGEGVLAAGLVPQVAVEQLLDLGREASRAATEAEAAEAALQAVGQVLESHQAVARRAREAAAANLVLLRDCISSLTAAGAADTDAEDPTEASSGSNNNNNKVNGSSGRINGSDSAYSGGAAVAAAAPAGRLVELRELRGAGGVACMGGFGGSNPLDAADAAVAVRS